MSTKRKPQHRSPVPKPKYRYEVDAARPALPPPPPVDPIVAQVRNILGHGSMAGYLLSSVLPQTRPEQDDQEEPQ